MKNDKKKCPECGSEKLIKHGIRFAGRKGNRAKVQQYQCRDCGRITVKPIGGNK